MKSLSAKLGVILIGLAIFINAEVWGAEWKLHGSTEKILGYYDIESITRPSQNIVRVWVRMNYTEKGVIDKVGKFGKEYENLSHSICLFEMDCAEKKLRLLSYADYDNMGGRIDSSSFPSKWDFITPETIDESLYKEVCK